MKQDKVKALVTAAFTLTAYNGHVKNNIIFMEYMSAGFPPKEEDPSVNQFDDIDADSEYFKNHSFGGL